MTVATAAVVCVLVAVAGCRSDRPAGQPASSQRASAATAAAATASCPAASSVPLRWPAGSPSGLPVVPGGELVSVQPQTSGFTVYTVRSPGSVRTNLLRALAGLRTGGWAIGRGSDSSGESRVPFTRAGHPGVLRLLADGACRTTWQLQV